MKRLRILFVLGSLGVGGTERQVIEILRHLDRKKFEPQLYVIYRRGELVEQVPPDVPIHAYWDRHSIPRFALPGQTLFAQARDLTRTIHAERIDLVYDRASHMAITAGLATPKEVPRVSTVVADPPRDFTNSHPQFRWIKKRLLRRSYLRADRVLAVSEGVRQGLIEFHHLPGDKVTTCPNLYDFVRIRELAQVDCSGFESNRFHIVCSGRLQREKGQTFLLQAFGKLADQKSLRHGVLWLLGTGPDDQALRQLAASLGISEQVRFAGFQANPHRYVARANAFCLPSLFEGMPNALVEAMACGVPAIASDCPSGPRELLDHGRFGQLVPPGDPQRLADAIESIIRDETKWRAIAREAQSHVEQTYSVDVGMARLEKLLIEVAAAK